jgi:hypothetical protein
MGIVHFFPGKPGEGDQPGGIKKEPHGKDTQRQQRRTWLGCLTAA